MAKPRGPKPPVTQKPKTPAASPAAATQAVSAQAAAEPPRKRPTPGQFFREVRAEARKISWTSRKETWITSVMVLIMVVAASVFLSLVDLILRFGISGILKLGS